MLRNISSAVPMFYGYNVPISQFVNDCREIQSVVLPHEETNILILLRGKLHGRIRKALHNRTFTNIKQFRDRLKTSFRATKNIYAELKKLCVKWESIIDYIERAQIVYDNIIQAEKSEKEFLTDSDVARINCRFMHAFYGGLSSNIRTLIEKRNDLSPIEMYEMYEKTNQQVEVRYESQWAYSATWRYPWRYSVRIQWFPKLP